MKKLLFIILLIWFWPVITVNGQTLSSEWVWFSEFSPTSRSGDNRVLKNANDNFQLEWRNRMGKMVSANTAIGIIVNYRHYNIQEALTYDIDTYSSSYSYDYNISNSLLGTGAFMTRLVQINKKLQFQATLYSLYEMGNGTYNMTLQGFNCPSCSTPGFNFGVRTGDIENLTIKERNFFAGLDLGVAYAVSSRLSLLTGFNLMQYENFSISDSNRISPTLSTSPLYRELEVQGNSITSAFDRPIFHIGIMLVLGNKAI